MKWIIKLFDISLNAVLLSWLVLVAKKIVEKEKEFGELKINAFVYLFWNVKLLFSQCMGWMNF